MDTEINLLLFYVFIARNNAITLTISKGMNLYFLCNHEWTFQLMRYSAFLFCIVCPIVIAVWSPGLKNYNVQNYTSQSK